MSQLWKLNGNKLKNGEGFWYSADVWNFTTKDDLVYVENISKSKVLGTTNNNKVILEDFKGDKAGQLWKKSMPNAEGYFNLENSVVPKVLTFMQSTSSSGLEIKGNITLR